MTAEENVELVQRFVDAFAKDGIEGALPYLAPDVVSYPFPEWVEASDYPGHDGARAIIGVWTENFDEFEARADEYRAMGDNVVTLGEMVGRIKGSGAPVRQPIGAVYSDFREERIGEIRYFLTWDEALEAAGE